MWAASCLSFAACLLLADVAAAASEGAGRLEPEPDAQCALQLGAHPLGASGVALEEDSRHRLTPGIFTLPPGPWESLPLEVQSGTLEMMPGLTKQLVAWGSETLMRACDMSEFVETVGSQGRPLSLGIINSLPYAIKLDALEMTDGHSFLAPVNGSHINPGQMFVFQFYARSTGLAGRLRVQGKPGEVWSIAFQSYRMGNFATGCDAMRVEGVKTSDWMVPYDDMCHTKYPGIQAKSQYEVIVMLADVQCQQAPCAALPGSNKPTPPQPPRGLTSAVVSLPPGKWDQMPTEVAAGTLQFVPNMTQQLVTWGSEMLATADQAPGFRLAKGSSSVALNLGIVNTLQYKLKLDAFEMTAGSSYLKPDIGKEVGPGQMFGFQLYGPSFAGVAGKIRIEGKAGEAWSIGFQFFQLGTVQPGCEALRVEGVKTSDWKKPYADMCHTRYPGIIKASAHDIMVLLADIKCPTAPCKA